MNKKLQVNKREQWIKQGAPEQALEFLGNTVDALNTVAIEKQIVFKGEDVMAEDIVAEVVDTEVVNTEETVPTDTPTEVVPEQTSTSQEPVNMMEVIQKGIVDAVQVALKEYNASVVVPLQAQLAEMTAKFSVTEKGKPTIQKGFSQMENVFFGASDFMPAAAVAEMLKKEFGSNSTQTANTDVVVENVETLDTVVKEKKVTAGNDSSNVLAGF